jgi:hypothetical protein
MSRWSAAGVVVGLAVAGVVAVSLPDLLRYLRISRM